MKKMLTLCILLCTTFLFVCAQDLTPEEQRTKFIDQCKAYLGTPYKYGGISKTGMDCSGFIYISARQALDIKLPRRAEDLYNATERLDKAQLQPGDFLFLNLQTVLIMRLFTLVMMSLYILQAMVLKQV